MTLHAREWEEAKRYPHLFKPKGCPLRRSKPKGPIKGCEEACQVFESCVELARREKAHDEWLVKELERLDSFDARGA